MVNKHKNILLGAGLVAALSFMSPTHAIPLLEVAGGGYGTLAMGPNDDGSSNLLDLQFGVNFFGNTYSNFFINNNGNITFNARVGSYTPTPFPASSNPMIAPYWGDVDTSCSTCGEVFVGALNAETTIVTWHDVGFYPSNPTLTNDFQLVLRNQAATTGTAGDFDVEFRYNRLEWTTGGASGGSGGLGGIQAQAGYDAGDSVNFFQLPGSRTAAVLNLADTSNVSAATPGLWSFAIRDGALPGETPDNPLLPVIVDGEFQFDFNVNLNQQIFVDPVIAIGYDYVVTSGTNFASVQLPNLGDNMYDLWLWNGTEYVDSGTDIASGIQYTFAASEGVDRFRIMGIETGAMLDPTDPTAFVTGLTFIGSGLVSMTQTPVTIDTDGSTQVPEPASLALMGLGLIGLGMTRRRRKAVH